MRYLIALIPLLLLNFASGIFVVDGEEGKWVAEKIFTDTAKIDGIAYGDIDKSIPGNEIISVGLSGNVVMIYKVEEWRSKVLWTGEGEIIKAAIGNFDPSTPDNEIAVAGMEKGKEGEGGAGAVYMISSKNDSWVSKLLHKEIAPDALMHGVAVGNLDKSTPEDEIIAVSHSGNAVLIRKVGDEWNSTVLFKDSAELKSVIIGDVDKHEGIEAIVVGLSGNVTMIYNDKGNWVIKNIYKAEGGLNRIDVGDVDNAYEGNEILVSGNVKDVILLYKQNEQWNGKKIWSDVDKVRGVGIGDFHPSLGKEIVITGFSKNVTILMLSKSGLWLAGKIWSDVGRLHDIVVANVDEANEGDEIITGGYSNNITLIGYYIPDFLIEVTPNSQTLIERQETAYLLCAYSKNYFEGNISISATNIPDGMELNFSQKSFYLTDTITIDIKIKTNLTLKNGIYNITLIGSDGTTIRSAYLVLNASRIAGLSIISPKSEKLQKGATKTYIFTVKNNGTIPDKFNLVAESKKGWRVEVNGTTGIIQPGQSENVYVKLFVPKDAAGKDDILTLKVVSTLDANVTSKGEVKIKVEKEKAIPGFEFLIILVGMLICMSRKLRNFRSAQIPRSIELRELGLSQEKEKTPISQFSFENSLVINARIFKKKR
ncbi:MAG: hypothetical protein AB1779_06510 [Candidatus Thermoplasmatota archaeon]